MCGSFGHSRRRHFQPPENDSGAPLEFRPELLFAHGAPRRIDGKHTFTSASVAASMAMICVA